MLFLGGSELNIGLRRTLRTGLVGIATLAPRTSPPWRLRKANCLPTAWAKYWPAMSPQNPPAGNPNVCPFACCVGNPFPTRTIRPRNEETPVGAPKSTVSRRRPWDPKPWATSRKLRQAGLATKPNSGNRWQGRALCGWQQS